MKRTNTEAAGRSRDASLLPLTADGPRVRLQPRGQGQALPRNGKATSRRFTQNMRHYPMLHNIGKIYNASDILNKPGMVNGLE